MCRVMTLGCCGRGLKGQGKEHRGLAGQEQAHPESLQGEAEGARPCPPDPLTGLYSQGCGASQSASFPASELQRSYQRACVHSKSILLAPQYATWCSEQSPQIYMKLSSVPMYTTMSFQRAQTTLHTFSAADRSFRARAGEAEGGGDRDRGDV